MPKFVVSKMIKMWLKLWLRKMIKNTKSESSFCVCVCLNSKEGVECENKMLKSEKKISN